MLDTPRPQYMPDFVPGKIEDFEFFGEDDFAIQRFYNGDDEFCGFIESHVDKKKDQWCGGYVCWQEWWVFKLSGHRLIQVAPLTVMDSLGCKRCDFHIWLKNGQVIRV